MVQNSLQKKKAAILRNLETVPTIYFWKTHLNITPQYSFVIQKATLHEVPTQHSACIFFSPHTI